MYKVVSECNKNEVWATEFYSKEKAQQRIDEGYYHQFMYEQDKGKKLNSLSSAVQKQVFKEGFEYF